MIDPKLAAELPQLSDKTLGMFIRACELAVKAYDMLVPERLRADQIDSAASIRVSLATAIAERERRK